MAALRGGVVLCVLFAACAGVEAATPGPGATAADPLLPPPPLPPPPLPPEPSSLEAECADALALRDRDRLLTWSERHALARLDRLCEQLAAVAGAATERSGCAHTGLLRVVALRRQCWWAAVEAARARAQGDVETSLAASQQLISLADLAPRIARSSCPER